MLRPREVEDVTAVRRILRRTCSSDFLRHCLNKPGWAATIAGRAGLRHWRVVVRAGMESSSAGQMVVNNMHGGGVWWR